MDALTLLATMVRALAKTLHALTFLLYLWYDSFFYRIQGTFMSLQPEGKGVNLVMDAASVYREDVYTDRKVGTIRCLTPVNSDGTPDAGRKPSFIGEAQILTPMGAIPVTFEIEATGLAEAIKNYEEAAKEGVERTVKEIQEYRRQQASSIVIPQGGAGGMPGLGGGGGGKIQIP